ncbi:metalloendopeptidase [Microbotryomycetes sp. JL221]|nr:metalloendopeptidase [Microbotryomycetes sp. JL221]
MLQAAQRLTRIALRRPRHQVVILAWAISSPRATRTSSLSTTSTYRFSDTRTTLTATTSSSSIATSMMASSSDYSTPPVLPPKWVLTADDIRSNVNSALRQTDSLLDSIGNLGQTKPSECTFETVVRPLALRGGQQDKQIEPSLFMQYVATDKQVRDASVEADKQAQDHGLSSLTRLDVYKALEQAKQHTNDNKVHLKSEEQRLMDRMILDRTRAGLALPEDKRNQLLEINKRIMSLEVDFQKNCNEENGFLLLTAEELDGVPDIDGYAKEGDKYKVTFKTPDIVPLFKYANLPETRRKAVMGYEGKTSQNTPLLQEIVKLRQQAAELLGYKNHAEFILEIKMAKTPTQVMEFLNDLETKLKPMGEKERQALLELKKEEHEKRGWEFDGEFRLWDYRYYDRLYTEKTLNVDENKIAEYFVVSEIVPKMLKMYEDILGVKVEPVPREEKFGGVTWHKEAEQFAIKESSTGSHLGYLVLDLFPRENKYGHAAVWSLLPGYTAEDGQRSYPVSTMVANLSKPSPSRPALMKHNDLVTLFHEAGHAWHGLLSQTQFAKFAGTSVARDFVEAPSQMLENWMWEPKVLKSLSSHYKTGEQLDDKTIEGLVKSRNVNSGLFNLRQLFFGKFDMLLHTTHVEADQTKLWNDLREQTSLVNTDGEYVPGQSGFAHITGGYSAGYYGYLYSQVFSADMYETVFKSDPMSPESGLKYRREILQPGGSRDEMDSLIKFLGREPNAEAFLKSLLGGSDSTKAAL